jgi:hypothetical protein
LNTIIIKFLLLIGYLLIRKYKSHHGLVNIIKGKDRTMQQGSYHREMFHIAREDRLDGTVYNTSF